MLDIGKRIEAALEQARPKKVAQTAVAKACNVTKQAVSGWIKTGKVDKKHLPVIAAMTGVDLNWLLTGEGEMFGGVAEPNARYSSAIIVGHEDDEIPDPKVFAMLPLLNAELAAGAGINNGDEQPEFFLSMRKSTLRRCNVQEANAKAVHITGSSMEPVLSDGDKVGIDLADSWPITDGETYALLDTDMLRVKTLYNLPGGGLRLRSFNRDEYPDEILTGDEVRDRITVRGRVFWSSKIW